MINRNISHYLPITIPRTTTLYKTLYKSQHILPILIQSLRLPNIIKEDQIINCQMQPAKLKSLLTEAKFIIEETMQVTKCVDPQRWNIRFNITDQPQNTANEKELSNNSNILCSEVMEFAEEYFFSTIKY